MGMKTIKQTADELGITTQAVYKKINKSMKNELRNYLKTVNKQILIDEQGINLIRDSLQPLPTVVNQSTNETIANNEEIESNENTNHSDRDFKFFNEQILFLRDQLKLLQEELRIEREHSREQSDKVISLAEQLAELNKNNQILLKQEQEKTTLLLPEQLEVVSLDEQKNKKGLFQKIFKNKKER